ncbi:MAG TPA: RhuM family protein [Bacteroidales bacterium]|nr:RhuM family protein [Bacteroidales bacterium]
MKNEIILYRPNELAEHIEVRLEDETVWLSLNQIAQLFDRDKSVISRHLRNVFKSGELVYDSTVAKNATVQIEAGREVKREIEFYNLDAILSVGYRVNSKQGTQFRIWATRVLKEYLLKGYAVNNRINRMEENIYSLTKRVDEIDFQIKTSLPPNEGIFFDGQVFDAHIFVSQLIKSAKESLILIDNYVDESVFMLLAKRTPGVEAVVFTSHNTKSLQHDLAKHNQQYPPIEMRNFTKAHDRFLIIDNAVVYHIGASLKDLGKKWFAFSKIDFDVHVLIENLNTKF